jgi:phosphotriesterase-related protein
MRTFVLFLPGILLCLSTGLQAQRIQTIRGLIPAKQMGLSLIHEHVFLDWAGALKMNPAAWNNDSATAVILPYLRAMQKYGVKTILECTPNYIGRNPRLLARLADSTGLQILTNTGYYGARWDLHIPTSALRENVDQIAQHWIEEYEQGIEGTGIRPGFIKIGVDGDSTLSAIDERLVRAAARTHLRTGLSIVAHTGPDQLALRQVEILAEEGVALQAWVWTHAQGGTDAVRAQLARQGAWISLDGLGWVNPAERNGDSTALMNYVNAILYLKKTDLLHRLLLSHDAGWYTHGEPGGGRFQPYTLIFTHLLPLLRQYGVTEQEIEQVLVQNPQEAYGIRVRRR